MNHTQPLRHVLIGAGAGVLGMHRPALELESVELVAVSDINAEVGRQRAEELARQAGLKMVFALLLFVFPAMLIVILGPSIPAFETLFSQLRGSTGVGIAP